MRVLIVKTSAMGDILHALPVLSYLHKVKPGIEIDWVVEEAFAGLLAENPLISRLHLVRFKKWKKHPLSIQTLREILQTRSSLAERNYDLVFDIQGNIKSGMITWLTGSDQRLGFTREVTQERLNTFFTNRQIPLREIDRHITDQYLRVASIPFGHDFNGMDLQTTLPVTDENELWADRFVRSLSDGLIFLFHTGTTWQTKFWYEQGWVELGKMLVSAFPESTILFSWGNDSEQQAAQGISEKVGTSAKVLDRMPIERLSALVSRVDMVTGGDTGIVHLAAAAGTPTVSYYRSSDGLRSGPRGDLHRIVQTPLQCSRCFKTSCNKDQQCRESITPQMLFAEISSILS